MKAQEVFDKVAIHLLIQNEQSANEGTCLYRSEDGLMCAVGCIIKDEHYSEDLEKKSFDHKLVTDAVRKSIGRLSGLKVNILNELQTLHDGEFISNWSTGLTRIAYRYGLNTDAVDFAVEYRNGML